MVTVVCGVKAGSLPSVGVAAMAHSGSLMISHELSRSRFGLPLTAVTMAFTTLLTRSACFAGVLTIEARNVRLPARDGGPGPTLPDVVLRCEPLDVPRKIWLR